MRSKEEHHIMSWLFVMTAAILLFIEVTTPVHAFSARLSRPWDGSALRSRPISFLRLSIAELSSSSTKKTSSSSSTEGTRPEGKETLATDSKDDYDFDDDDDDDDDEETEVLSLQDTEQHQSSSSFSPSSSRQVVVQVGSSQHSHTMPTTAVIAPRSKSSPLTQLQAVTRNNHEMDTGSGEPEHISPSSSSKTSSSSEPQITIVPNGAGMPTPPPPTPSVRSCLKELIQMSRPVNDPVVVLLHMLGVFLALQSHSTTTNGLFFWKFLASPSMMIVLVALLLTSSTSMLVNDYYDYKLGNDEHKATPSALAAQKVPLVVVKRFVSYLYAAALVCVALIPGIPARLSVVGGLMLTFWYTQHLKPRTWLKNVVCASLIALSPLTSGTSALAVLASSSSSTLAATATSTMAATSMAPLGRVVGMLFVGILGREMTMDMNDLEDDKTHGVRTVPVKYGRKFASRVAFGCTVGTALFALSGPVVQVGRVLRSVTPSSSSAVAAALVAGTPGLLRRCALAGVGSLLQLRRATQVLRSEGQDSTLNGRAVNEGLVTVVLLLASFV